MRLTSVTSRKAEPLPREFYCRDTISVARDLLGKLLVLVYRGMRLSGRIVEVEAYIGEDDPACHARFGPTDRNRVMYGPGGFSYVYFIYGMYNMLNIVTEKAGSHAALLIRALEPIDGIERMRELRSVRNDVEISNGPGKLCRALSIDTRHSGLDLTGSRLFVADIHSDPPAIAASRRIGIKEGLDRNWRFFVEGSKYVSRNSGGGQIDRGFMRRQNGGRDR